MVATTALRAGAGISPALAQSEVAKLLADDGAPEDFFGWSVVVSGNTTLIGAPWDDDNGVNSGSAYVFRFDGSRWTPEQKLLPDDGEAGEYFGSLAIWGDTAVIGATFDDDNGYRSGSAYVFRFDGSTWTLEQKLLADDGAPEDRFGCSVGVWGSTALIGAFGDADSGVYSGSAYVFRYNGSSWVQEQKLTAEDIAQGDEFGKSVDISGATALIGAGADDDNGNWSGSAYVFRYNGSNWVQEQKLLPLDGAVQDFFGKSVAISGHLALIGARGDDDNGYDSGSAYVFRYNGSSWVQEQKLLPSDGAADDWFGNSLAIFAGTAVVGAWYDGDNGYRSGSAYVFEYDGSRWVQEAKLLPSDGAAGDQFGISVSVCHDTAVIGAWRDDENGYESGSAYVFDLAAPTCVGDLDGDNDTDAGDLEILLADWGCITGECIGDLDSDGDTDHSDLGILLADWGCGT